MASTQKFTSLKCAKHPWANRSLSTCCMLAMYVGSILCAPATNVQGKVQGMSKSTALLRLNASAPEAQQILSGPSLSGPRWVLTGNVWACPERGMQSQKRPK